MKGAVCDVLMIHARIGSKRLQVMFCEHEKQESNKNRLFPNLLWETFTLGQVGSSNNQSNSIYRMTKVYKSEYNLPFDGLIIMIVLAFQEVVGISLGLTE